MHFDELLVTGASWALGLGALWAGLVAIAAAVVEVVSEGRVALTARLGCPASARRALLAGFSVVLAGGGALAAGPVAATPAPFGARRRTGQGLTLPVPTRPTGTGARRTARSGWRCTRATASGGSRSSASPRGLGTRTSLASSSAPTAPTAA